MTATAMSSWCGTRGRRGGETLGSRPAACSSREKPCSTGCDVKGARGAAWEALADPRLTRILQQTLTDGVRTRPGYFAQIVARAESATARPGPDVVEARWFDHLPENLAFRDDYVTDFARFVRG